MTNDSQSSIVAVAVTAPLWPEHFGTDLEIAAMHLARGDDVHLLVCEGGLPSCTARPRKDRASCIKCRFRTRRGIRLLGLPTNRVHLAPTIQPAEGLIGCSFADFRDIDADSSQAGRAAASSLVSCLREPAPDLQQHRDLARSLLATASNVYSWTTAVLQTHGVDKLVVFNGRFVNALPAVTAARRLGIPVVAHERNWNATGFILRSSGSVHNLEEMGALLETAKQAVSQDREAKSRAIQWFEGRRFPMTSDPIQKFTVEQNRGLLPVGFDRHQRNVSVFVSSEDEFVALAEWRHRFCDSQEQTITALITHADLNPDIVFWVRVHPNLSGLDNAQTARLDTLAEGSPANLRVIPATSNVDSYALLEACELTITFGSTIGAEATYWETPCLLLAPAMYERLDGTTVPSSIDEAISFINAGLPTPVSSDALPFGSLMTDTDHLFVHYRSPTATEPESFRGESLAPTRPVRLHIKLARFVTKTGFVLRRLERRITRSA